MIKILNRYIAQTMLFATVTTTLIVSAIMLMILLLGEVKSIGEGDYQFYDAVWYVILRLPNEIYQFSPMLILLSSIVGLSILSTHRELAVMRVSGFSVRNIIMSVLGAALIFILTISTIGELIGPQLSYKAALAKQNAKNEGQAVITSAGMWMHVQNNFIHVQHVIGRRYLEGVTRYEFDQQHKLQAAYFAKKLTFDGEQWQMFNVVKTSFHRDRAVSEAFAEAPWQLTFNANLLGLGLVEPSQMSLHHLAQFANYLKRNGLQSKDYQFEFWQRLLQPFASLIMIFLAIPVVLKNVRTTMGWRILAGVLMGFSFYILDALFSQLCIVLQIPPVLAAVLPLLVFTGLGIFLCRRIYT